MADATYVIEVASQVSGVSATTAEVDDLSRQLDGSGVNAAMFDDALAELAGRMTQARAATQAANAELAESKARYAELEQSAVRAAKAAERAEESAAAKKEKAQKKLADAQKGLDKAVAAGDAKAVAKYTAEVDKASASLREVGAAGEKSVAKAKAASAAAEKAARDHAQELDKVQNKADEAARAEQELAEQTQKVARVQQHVNDKLGDAATNLSTFRGALGDIGGPLGETVERMMFPAQAFVDLNEKFGRGVAIGTVAAFGLARAIAVVVKALAAVAVALVAATAALLAFAVKASNAARELHLTRRAAAALTPELRGIPWAEITDATGVAEKGLRELSRSLLDAGVSAAQLPEALEAAAKAETALGQGGADQFIEQLRAGEMSVREFSNTVDRELGDVVARRLLGLEAQGQRFKRNLSRMFGGFDIEPVLEGLDRLVGLFDENSASGRAMRKALSGILDPIIDEAKNAAFAIEAFALGFAIGATKIYIGAKPAIDKLTELLGIEGDWDLDATLDKVAAAGEWLAPVLATVVTMLAVLGVAVAGVVAVILGLNVVLMEAIGAVTRFGAQVLMGVVRFFASLVEVVGGAISYLGGVAGRFAEVGGAIVEGIASGIRNAAGTVIAAVTDVAGGAIDAAKAALGIASPSAVLAAEVGEPMGEGVAVGLSRTKDAAHEELRKLTDPKEVAPSPSAGSAAGSSTTHTSSSSAITFEKGSITITDRAAAEAFMGWIEGLAARAT